MSIDGNEKDFAVGKKTGKAKTVLGQEEADEESMMTVSKSILYDAGTSANWLGNLLIIIDKGEGLRKRYNNHFFSSLIEIDFGWPTIWRNFIYMVVSCFRIYSTLGDSFSFMVLMKRLSNARVD